MSNDLMDLENTDLVTADSLADLLATEQPSQFATPSVLAEIAGSSFLPFVRVMGGNCKEVKRGEFPIGNFALQVSQASLINLGPDFIMMVLAWRPKAMQYQPDVVSVFNPADPVFKNIQATADLPNSGKGYGPEFLLWLPDYDRFAVYFLGNKTGRNEAPNLARVLEGPTKVCKQRIHLIEARENSWHAGRTLPHDAPIKMPTMDALKRELHKFNNPPVTAVKEVAEKDESSRE